MGNELTEHEWERIRAFAETPSYARTPEMLLPPGAEDADD